MKVILVFSFLFSVFNLLFSVNAEERFVYNVKGKRDPFMPLVTSEGRLIRIDAEGDSAGLLLEGIIFDQKGSSYAIVNGSIVKAGDIIDGYHILKIEKDKLTLVKEGEIYEVKIKKEDE